MNRFTETPLDAVLWLSGISIRVETNCQTAVDELERARTPSMENAGDAPDFLLRVVAESEEDFDLGLAWGIHHLSRDGLFFISLGRKSFLACDWQAHQAMCFISQNLATDDAQFSQHFLPALILLLKESIETLS